MVATVESLARFPVKGLSAEALSSVLLEAGQGFPSDRKFGFARPNSGFDPNAPQPLPKTKFYMLARDATLALLNTRYDDKTGVLSIEGPDNAGQFDINTADGKDSASQFLQSYLSLSNDETPQLYEASPHRFTDVSVVSTEMMNAISIINVDSVRAFSNAIGKDVDPRRFRGNIHLTNLAAFSELDMVGEQISIGEVRVKIVKRTKRCPATEVDLATGVRDLKTPKLLLENYGHMDMGIYAEVLEGGMIYKGDIVKW